MIHSLPFGEIIPPLREVATARRRGEVERWGVGQGRRSHYRRSQLSMMAGRRANLPHGVRTDRASKSTKFSTLEATPVGIGDAAQDVGVAASTVHSAKRILRDAAPEVIQTVDGVER